MAVASEPWRLVACYCMQAFLKRQVLRLVLKDENEADSVNDLGREFHAEGAM